MPYAKYRPENLKKYQMVVIKTLKFYHLVVILQTAYEFWAEFWSHSCFKINHASQNSFNKWTKISSHEITVFELKNDGKKWSRIYFEIDRAPSELLLPSAKISAQIGRIGLAAQQVSLKGLGQFQNKFQTTFYHHF